MKYRKKPVEVEAEQLTKETIRKVYEFIHGEDCVKLNCDAAFDAWETYEKIVIEKGMELKTPESGEGTQIASIGDYVVKGYSEGLGYHFWPVKPDYFESAYDLIPKINFSGLPTGVGDLAVEESRTKRLSK